jgi:hypothetical protein
MSPGGTLGDGTALGVFFRQKYPATFFYGYGYLKDVELRSRNFSPYDDGVQCVRNLLLLSISLRNIPKRHVR